MQRFVWIFAALSLLSQQRPQPPAMNTDEAKAGAYRLPELGAKSRADWESRRRREVLAAFAANVYGVTPQIRTRLRARVLAVKQDAVQGLARRSLIRLELFEDPAAPHIDLLLYVPKAARGPVPVYLGLNYLGLGSVEADPELPMTPKFVISNPEKGVVDNRVTEKTRGAHASRWPLELALRRGYAVATYFYGDLEEDYPEGWRDGLKGYLRRRAGQSLEAVAQPDEWGALGVWAWGLSRCLDYLESNPAVDAKRVVVFGHSRHGKTALWAGAQDRRFAAVIANNSGEGGASLGRRNFGETIALSIYHAARWYCPRYREFVGRPEALPTDQHLLVALAAPRPVYIASASEDLGADPKGEFLAAWHAGPAYQLYGWRGLEQEEMPPAEKPLGLGPKQRVGYHLRRGKHDITAYDWEQFLHFTDQHLPRR